MLFVISSPVWEDVAAAARRRTRLPQAALTFSIRFPLPFLWVNFLDRLSKREINGALERRREREMSFISCLWKKLKLFISNHSTNSGHLLPPSWGQADPDVPPGDAPLPFVWAGTCWSLPALLQAGTWGTAGKCHCSRATGKPRSPSQSLSHRRAGGGFGAEPCTEPSHMAGT